MSLDKASPYWRVKAREGSSYRLSDLRICFLFEVMKLGIQGVFRSGAVSFSLSFSTSPPLPTLLE